MVAPRSPGYRRGRPRFTAGHCSTRPRQEPWRARCGESRTPGSVSGLGKRTSSNAGTAPQADSTLIASSAPARIAALRRYRIGLQRSQDCQGFSDTRVGRCHRPSREAVRLRLGTARSAMRGGIVLSQTDAARPTRRTGRERGVLEPVGDGVLEPHEATSARDEVWVGDAPSSHPAQGCGFADAGQSGDAVDADNACRKPCSRVRERAPWLGVASYQRRGCVVLLGDGCDGLPVPACHNPLLDDVLGGVGAGGDGASAYELVRHAVTSGDLANDDRTSLTGATAPSTSFINSQSRRESPANTPLPRLATDKVTLHGRANAMGKLRGRGR